MRETVGTLGGGIPPPPEGEFFFLFFQPLEKRRPLVGRIRRSARTKNGTPPVCMRAIPMLTTATAYVLLYHGTRTRM